MMPGRKAKNKKGPKRNEQKCLPSKALSEQKGKSPPSASTNTKGIHPTDIGAAASASGCKGKTDQKNQKAEKKMEEAMDWSGSSVDGSMKEQPLSVQPLSMNPASLNVKMSSLHVSDTHKRARHPSEDTSGQLNMKTSGDYEGSLRSENPDPTTETHTGARADSLSNEQEADSQDSGSDYDNIEMEECSKTKPAPYDANRTWKGIALNLLKTTPSCLSDNFKLERSTQHFVAIKPQSCKPHMAPEPTSGQDKWDTDHVRMPHSYHSKCYRSDGREVRRWDLIVEALSKNIRGPFELEEAILSYNQRYINKWKFTVLHYYFTKHVKYEDREQFFEVVLPMMTKLALWLPDACPMLPLLRRDKAKKLTLSQLQISCLLANAFFCTFPLRNSRTRASEYSSYPDINFSHLFTGDPVSRKVQKLHCIIHYFRRVLFSCPVGIVTFARQMLNSSHNWYSAMENLKELHVSSTGTIEDNGQGMLQVDFANKYVGGGVLGHGCVQEEIRFIICPEMIIARLFTEGLGPMESLIMTGCERFSEYEGYSDSFRWKGDYVDKTPRDSFGRLCCEVVAIDAQVFRSDYYKQFKRFSLERELNKAYCGFKTNAKLANTTAVCTGNWGCGAFGGDKQLKAMIQLMAAAVAKRDVCYFTFDDEQLTGDLYTVHQRLSKKEKTVGDIFSMLCDYNSDVLLTSRHSKVMTLFDFIHGYLDREEARSRHGNIRHSWSSGSSKDNGKTARSNATSLHNDWGYMC